jgi:hypothetical protein
MPGITQTMGGSDSKYLKHCIKKGKGKGLPYIQQQTKNIGEANIKDTGLCAVSQEAAQTMHSTIYMC